MLSQVQKEIERCVDICRVANFAYNEVSLKTIFKLWEFPDIKKEE